KQGAKISLSQKNQSPGAATVCQRHPVAEHQPAQRYQQPGIRGHVIERFAQINDAGAGKQLGACQRNGQCDRKAMKLVAVLAGPDFSQSAMQAESGNLPADAEGQPNGQPGPQYKLNMRHGSLSACAPRIQSNGVVPCFAVLCFELAELGIAVLGTDPARRFGNLAILQRIQVGDGNAVVRCDQAIASVGTRRSSGSVSSPAADNCCRSYLGLGIG